MPPARASAGFTLLEALIALTILGIAGTAMIGVAGQAVATGAKAADEERVVQDLDRLITAYALLDRRDLERRIGTELVGTYAVTIGRLDLDLYAVSVGRQGMPADLSTVLYRRGTS